jgi:hypothetical protein
MLFSAGALLFLVTTYGGVANAFELRDCAFAEFTHFLRQNDVLLRALETTYSLAVQVN